MAAIDCVIDTKLRDALHQMKHDNVRAVVAILVNEQIHLHKVMDSTANFTADLESIRAEIINAKLEACFVVIRSPTSISQLLVVPESAKPRTRMMYAASSAKLRNDSGLAIAVDTHVSAIADIAPPLFEHTEEERREMMNEKEKVQEELSKLPPPPPPTAMAGVTNPLSEKAIAAAKAFCDGSRAATFAVFPTSIDVEKVLPADASIEDIIAAVPSDQPRYIILKWDTKTILAYICPPGIKPKERMPYASCKASFVAQVGANGISFDRKVEMDDVKTLEETITEALQDVDLQEAKPTAPKPVMHKGPRMLI